MVDPHDADCEEAGYEGEVVWPFVEKGFKKITV